MTITFRHVHNEYWVDDITHKGYVLKKDGSFISLSNWRLTWRTRLRRFFQTKKEADLSSVSHA